MQHHTPHLEPQQSQRDAGNTTHHLGACQLPIMPEKHRQSLSDAARRMQGATHHLIYKEYCLYPKFGHKIPLIINTSRITDAACQLPIMPEKHRQSKADAARGMHTTSVLPTSCSIHLGAIEKQSQSKADGMQHTSGASTEPDGCSLPTIMQHTSGASTPPDNHRQIWSLPTAHHHARRMQHTSGSHHRYAPTLFTSSSNSLISSSTSDKSDFASVSSIIFLSR